MKNDQDRPLTRQDRCDRCQAQAYVRAVLPQSTELLFCVHHFRLYRAALEGMATHIHNESHQLLSQADQRPQWSAARDAES
ncbi:hypothetical protein ACF08N_36940 [Streptomyces sp. NPDC015127]|uniref:DUF7455 domain-containing protein n=1 Tax=Streptomyces sp. NPDC015127 TaxID=3364939 RepID=UPI0037006F46